MMLIDTPGFILYVQYLDSRIYIRHQFLNQSLIKIETSDVCQIVISLTLRTTLIKQPFSLVAKTNLDQENNTFESNIENNIGLNQVGSNALITRTGI